MFQALATISVEFAKHGRGLMPHTANQTVERAYIKYREQYNSYS